MKVYFILFTCILIYGFIPQSTKAQNKSSEISVANKNEGKISKAELLNSGGLQSSDSTHRIMSFDMTIYTQEVNTSDSRDSTWHHSIYYASGHQLTDIMKSIIKDAPNGSLIVFGKFTVIPIINYGIRLIH